MKSSSSAEAHAMPFGHRVSPGNPTAASIAAALAQPISQPTDSATSTRELPHDQLGTAASSVSKVPSSEVVAVEAVATVTTVSESGLERTTRTTTVAVSALDQSNAQFMGDAPACDVCGSITVRNGTCYRCLNCGNSMGCS